jgi:hypothetical protein
MEDKTEKKSAISKPKPAKPAKRARRKVKTRAKPAKAFAPRKKPAPRKEPATPILFEQIQLRAYYISEKRRREALPGDEYQDWVEAERQLLDEQKAAVSKLRRKKKK